MLTRIFTPDEQTKQANKSDNEQIIKLNKTESEDMNETPPFSLIKDQNVGRVDDMWKGNPCQAFSRSFIRAYIRISKGFKTDKF